LKLAPILVLGGLAVLGASLNRNSEADSGDSLPPAPSPSPEPLPLAPPITEIPAGTFPTTWEVFPSPSPSPSPEPLPPAVSVPFMEGAERSTLNGIELFIFGAWSRKYDSAGFWQFDNGTAKRTDYSTTTKYPFTAGYRYDAFGVLKKPW